MANRHDVFIWDAYIYSVEKDYYPAVQQVRALARQEAEPSDILLSFASSLKSRSQDKNLEPAVVRYLQHVEERLIASNTAALMLPLPEYEPHWRSLINILIEEISMYKLALCDEELELVFLPDGSMLSPRPLIDKKLDVIDTKGFPVSLKQFHELVKTKVGELLSEHGFIFIEEEDLGDDFSVIYDKAIKMVKLSLTISYQGGRDDFKPSIHFRIIEDNMIATAQKSDFSYPLGGGVFLNIISVLKLKEQLCINNWEKFEGLLCLLRASVLRWSDTIEDIKGIDSLINGDIDEAVKNHVHSSVYAPFALIAARLAGSPNFDKLAVSLGTYGAGSGRAWGKFSRSEVAIAWPKLVKYLREEVKPLV